MAITTGSTANAAANARRLALGKQKLATSPLITRLNQWRTQNADLRNKVMTREQSKGQMQYLFPESGGSMYSPSTGGYGIQPAATAATVTTPTVTTDAATLSAQDIASQKLALALRGQGMDWNYTPGQPYAPAASLVSGTAWKRIQNMPSLYTLMMQAAGASGYGATPEQSMAQYLAEIGLFQPTAPAYSGVSYGW